MSRVLTTYKQPSIATKLSLAPNIEELGKMRVGILLGIATRQLEPDQKTLARWEQELWSRVAQLLAKAERAGDLCYIYNCIIKWKRPSDDTGALIDRIFNMRANMLPSPTQELAARGISIEGVTP